MKMLEKRLINQRILSNLIWSLISESIGKSIFFLINILLARNLGVDNFGLFTLAQVIIYYLWVGSDLGTYTYGIREISKGQDNPQIIINPLLTIKITFGFLLFVLYSLFILLILRNHNLTQKLTFIGCGFYLITYPFYIDWILKGLEKFNYLIFGSFASSLTFLISVLYLVKDPHGVIVASFLWSLSYLFGGISLFIILRYKFKINYKPSFTKEIWRLHLKYSVFFSLAGICSMAYNYLPIFYLGLFANAHDTGIFSAPFRMVSSLSYPGYLVSIALFPIISELYQRDKQGFKTTNRIFSIISLSLGILFVVVGSLFGEELVLLMFGLEYKESIIIFKILILLLPLQFLRYRFSASIASTEYQKLQYVPLSMAIVFFSILICFFPKTIENISLVTLFSESILVVGYFWLGKLTYDKDI